MRKKIFVFTLTILLIVNVSVVPSSALTGVAILDNIAAMIASLAVSSGVMYINLEQDLDNFDDYLDNMPSTLSDVLEAEALENDNELTLTAQQYADFATYFRSTYDLDNMNLNEVYSLESYPTIPLTLDGVNMNVQIENDSTSSINYVGVKYFTNTYLDSIMYDRFYDFLSVGDFDYSFNYDVVPTYYSQSTNHHEYFTIRNDLNDYSSEVADHATDCIKVEHSYIKNLYDLDYVKNVLYLQREIEFNIVVTNDSSGVLVRLIPNFNVIEADTTTTVISLDYDPTNMYYSGSDEEPIATDLYNLRSNIYSNIMSYVPDITDATTPSHFDTVFYYMDLCATLGGIDSQGEFIDGTMTDLMPILQDIYDGTGQVETLPVYKNTLPYDYTGETEVTLPYVPGAVGTYEGVTSTDLATEGLDIPLQSGLSLSLDISSRYGISFLQNAFERLYILRNADSITPIKVTFDMKGIWNSLGNLSSFNAQYPFDSDDLTLIDLKYLDQWMFLGVSVRAYLRMIIASIMYLSTGLWLLSRVRKAA